MQFSRPCGGGCRQSNNPVMSPTKAASRGDLHGAEMIFQASRRVSDMYAAFFFLPRVIFCFVLEHRLEAFDHLASVSVK
jgi:hypothetical protein